MKLQHAQLIAERLIKRFATNVGLEGHIAGSVRRCKPEPRDIEIMLPWPGENAIDLIHDAIKRHCIVPPAPPPPEMKAPPEMIDLFTKTRVEIVTAPSATTTEADENGGERWFTVVKGLKPGFRYCQLACDPALVWPQARHVPAFKIDVFRYDPGPHGNFGWQMLIRTGPAEFSQQCLSNWKAAQMLSRDHKGSIDGYLVDHDGVRHATATEQEAFALLGFEWLPPELRAPGVRLVPLERNQQNPLRATG